MIQPIQIEEHPDQMDLYRVASGEFAGVAVAYIASEYGGLRVYKAEMGELGVIAHIVGDTLFTSTDFEACLTYVIGLAYLKVANKLA